MICPKCMVEYQEGYTICSDCGSKLAPSYTPAVSKGGGEWFTKFGATTAKSAIAALFFIGLIPLLYNAVLFGRNIYLNNVISEQIKFVQDGQTIYSDRMVNDLPLGVFGGIAYFVAAVLVWKIICELMIIVFRVFETYIKKNSSCEKADCDK